MKFCRNFADNLENVEILKFLNFLEKIPVLKEFEWFERFEWFGPSPIEPFNSGPDHHDREETRQHRIDHHRRQVREADDEDRVHHPERQEKHAALPNGGGQLVVCRVKRVKLPVPRE